MSKRRLLEDVCLAWLISAVILFVAAHVSNVNPWAAESFHRADSGLYLSIVDSGYGFFSCSKIAGMNPNQWCGNAGWMPGFPLLIKIVSYSGMNPREAGLLISNIAFFGCLILLRQIIEQIVPDRDNRLCFLTAAVFPGGIYLHAVFPISLLMLCALSSLVLLAQRRFLWASIVSAWGAFSYATGFLLAGVVGSAVLISPNASWARKFGDSILYSAIAFSGFLAVLVMHQILVDHWNAFFLVQEKYGHGIHNPLSTIVAIWRTLLRAEPAKLALAAQSLIISAMVPALFVFLLLRRQEISVTEWLAAIHVFLFWVFPLIMGSGVSLTRAEADLLPLTALMARLPRSAQLLVLVVFATLYFETGVAFFRSILV